MKQICIYVQDGKDIVKGLYRFSGMEEAEAKSYGGACVWVAQEGKVKGIKVITAVEFFDKSEKIPHTGWYFKITDFIECSVGISIGEFSEIRNVNLLEKIKDKNFVEKIEKMFGIKKEAAVEDEKKDVVTEKTLNEAKKEGVVGAEGKTEKEVKTVVKAVKEKAKKEEPKKERKVEKEVEEKVEKKEVKKEKKIVKEVKKVKKEGKDKVEKKEVKKNGKRKSYTHSEVRGQIVVGGKLAMSYNHEKKTGVVYDIVLKMEKGQSTTVEKIADICKVKAVKLEIKCKNWAYIVKACAAHMQYKLKYPLSLSCGKIKIL